MNLIQLFTLKIHSRFTETWYNFLPLNFTLLYVSSIRRGHANLLCIIPILSDVRKGLHTFIFGSDTFLIWQREITFTCSTYHVASLNLHTVVWNKKYILRIRVKYSIVDLLTCHDLRIRILPLLHPNHHYNRCLNRLSLNLYNHNANVLATGNNIPHGET